MGSIGKIPMAPTRKGPDLIAAVEAECYDTSHEYATYYTRANSLAWRRRILPWRPTLRRRGIGLILGVHDRLGGDLPDLFPFWSN
jgi:hypothetical protein